MSTRRTSSRRTANTTDSNSRRTTSATNRRRSRQRRSGTRRGTTRRAASSVTAEQTCIDLTNEPPDYHNEVVDLTSVTDSPVVILGSQEVYSSGRQRQQNTSERLNQIGQLDLDDSDAELEDLPDLGIISGSASESKSTAEESTSAIKQSMSSPEAVPLLCPVCLDSQKHILRTGRHLMSTMCGHIFCSECVDEILQNQKQCPNCRQKLTRKKVHQIYF